MQRAIMARSVAEHDVAGAAMLRLRRGSVPAAGFVLAATIVTKRYPASR
jgi:hypothetical protein